MTNISRIGNAGVACMEEQTGDCDEARIIKWLWCDSYYIVFINVSTFIIDSGRAEPNVLYARHEDVVW